MSVPSNNDMKLITYLNREGIMWQPVDLAVVNREKVYNTSQVAKASDYYSVSTAIIKERQKKVKDYKYIAIFTNRVHQIDIDEKTDAFNDILDGPYYPSSTKKLPHIFFRTEVGYTNDDKCEVANYKHKWGDVLVGMWAWAPVDAIVKNANKPIPILKDDYMKDKVKKEVKKRVKKEVKKEEIILKSETLVLKDNEYDITEEEFYKYVKDLNPLVRSLKYPEWFIVICALHNISSSLGLKNIDKAGHMASEGASNYDNKAKKFINDCVFKEDGPRWPSVLEYLPRQIIPKKPNISIDMFRCEEEKEIKEVLVKKQDQEENEIKVEEEEEEETRINDYNSWKKKFEEHHFHLITGNKIVSTFYEDLMQLIPNLVIELYNINNDFMDLIRYGETIKKIKTFYYNDWLIDKTKRSFYKLDFIPRPKSCPNDTFNLFDGFEVEKRMCKYRPRPLNKPTNIQTCFIKEVVQVFEDFIGHLCSNDKETINYLRAYIADIIQRPGLKPGVCIVIAGLPGCGKGSIYALLRALIGQAYCLKTSDINIVLGQFTGATSRKLVLNLDEAVPKKMFENNGSLKSLITEDTKKVEKKGDDAREESSFERIFISTNEENVVKIETGDRRFVVLEPSVMSSKLSNKFYKMLDQEQSILELFRYLKSVKIPYSNLKDWQDNRPLSKKYKEMRANNVPTHIKFLCKFIDSNPDLRIKIPWPEIYHAYGSFCLTNKFEDIGLLKLCHKLYKVGGIIKERWGKSERGITIEAKEFNKWLLSNKIEVEDYTEDLKEILQDN